MRAQMLNTDDVHDVKKGRKKSEQKSVIDRNFSKIAEKASVIWEKNAAKTERYVAIVYLAC